MVISQHNSKKFLRGVRVQVGSYLRRNLSAYVKLAIRMCRACDLSLNADFIVHQENVEVPSLTFRYPGGYVLSE